MKRWIRPLLLLALLVSVLTIGAAAAEPTTDGIYGVSQSGVITPRTADGSEVTASDAYYQKGFYADAVKFDVTCSGLTAGEQYLLLVLSDNGVPTDSNIVYINQTAADKNGTVTFEGMNAAYPSKLEKDKTYYVYVVGAGREFSAGAVATFLYYQAYTLGDVDENGSVQVGDAVKILESVVGKTELTKAQELAADVNKDGNVQVGDAVKVLEYVVGKITSFD